MGGGGLNWNSMLDRYLKILCSDNLNSQNKEGLNNALFLWKILRKNVLVFIPTKKIGLFCFEWWSLEQVMPEKKLIEGKSPYN